MGGSQSQSYDLSNESMKSVQDKRDIVPSNNVVDGTLIHITSAETSKTLSNIQVKLFKTCKNDSNKVYEEFLHR